MTTKPTDVVEAMAEASFNKYWAHEWANEDGIGRDAWLEMVEVAGAVQLAALEKAGFVLVPREQNDSFKTAVMVLENIASSGSEGSSDADAPDMWLHCRISARAVLDSIREKVPESQEQS